MNDKQTLRNVLIILFAGLLVVSAVCCTGLVAVVLLTQNYDRRVAERREATEQNLEEVRRLLEERFDETNELLADFGTDPVVCKVVLIGFDAESPWTDSKPSSVDHGVSARAEWMIKSPLGYAGKTFFLLINYEPSVVESNLNEERLGETYSIELPRDFLDGSETTIDNLSAGELIFGEE